MNSRIIIIFTIIYIANLFPADNTMQPFLAIAEVVGTVSDGEYYQHTMYIQSSLISLLSSVAC